MPPVTGLQHIDYKYVFLLLSLDNEICDFDQTTSEKLLYMSR